MRFEHIVVAVDESDVGRHALVQALAVGARAGSRVTALTTVPAPRLSTASAARDAAREARRRVMAPALADLRARIRSANRAAVPVDANVSYGIPGIEICRFAEEQGADLVVLGRKPRTQSERLLVGDTADAVARRSRVPCLFIPPGAVVRGPVVATVGECPRASRVVAAAHGFAGALGEELRLITVEPMVEPEPPDLQELLAAEQRARLTAILHSAVPGSAAEPAPRLITARGDVVERVLETAAGEAGVLVVGYRRGGPPAVAELGSVARRLAHGAACPVFTVPL